MWFNLYLLMNIIHASNVPGTRGWGNEVISYGDISPDPQYILGDEGVLSCPNGYEEIRDGNICQTALTALSITPSSSYFDSSLQAHVCFMNTFLNEAENNAHPGRSDKYICIQSTSPKSTTMEPTGEPTTSEPTTSEPTTSEPTTSEPTTSKPTTSEPTTMDPTEEPTLPSGGCPEIFDSFTDVWTEECQCATASRGCRSCQDELNCASCYDGYVMREGECIVAPVCPNWCGEHEKHWIEKCMIYPECTGCAECEHDYNKPENCALWCIEETRPWNHRCHWFERCKGCSECDLSYNQQDNCKVWCLITAHPWAEKCSYDDCDGCENCIEE